MKFSLTVVGRVSSGFQGVSRGDLFLAARRPLPQTTTTKENKMKIITSLFAAIALAAIAIPVLSQDQ